MAQSNVSSRDRLVVRTLRCGRSNPGSNPGHGSDLFFYIVENLCVENRYPGQQYICQRQWYNGEHSCLPSS